MMDEARLPGVELVQGRAEALPRPDASCDFLSMGYALRHIDDVAAAFAEFHRVLRRAAAAGAGDQQARVARWARWAEGLHARRGAADRARGLQAARHRAPVAYYWDTIEACIPPESIVEALRGRGLPACERYVELGIFSEYTRHQGGLTQARTARARVPRHGRRQVV
jgi:demethylmenaquinone methyltransferase/2-methoxy-6-polyprenyl-1,4-benzoquinol methylase